MPEPRALTPRHLAVLAMLEETPLIQPDEVAARVGVDVLDVETMLRELAEAGCLGA